MVAYSIRARSGMFRLPGFWQHPLQIPLSSAGGEHSPRAWHDPAQYEASAVLEAHFAEILAEVEALDGASGAYVANAEDATLLQAGEWSELRLYDQQANAWNDANCARLPVTCAILREIPSLRQSVGGALLPGVVSVFRLLPGSTLVPHTGPSNVRTTLHLGLQIPREGATITVGGETRGWKRGEVLAFDDSFVHVAENQGNTPRTVLLANVWKPVFCELHGCQSATAPSSEART
jgi:hypothetical protein